MLNNENGNKTTLILTCIFSFLIIAIIGLFVANNGGNKTKKEVKAPRQQVDQVRYSIKDNVNVVISKDNNVEVNDILNNKINLPAGFKISNDSPLTVEEGIVVEDEIGNQFVWIPVGKIITKNNEEKEIKIGRYDFKYESPVQTAENVTDESIIFNGYYEYDKNDNTLTNNTKAKDIADFVDSAIFYGGYYLARYEAGIEASNHNSALNEKINASKVKPLSKAKQCVWNSITQINAANTCKNMYTNNNFDSDLVNSYAWDTAIRFIMITNDKVISKAKASTTLSKTAEAAYTNGNKDVLCNIYDMIGNVREWTTESYKEGTNVSAPAVARGIDFNTTGGDITLRSVAGANQELDNVGFRPIIYLK